MTRDSEMSPVSWPRLDGPVVVVTAPVAHRLVGPLREALRKAKANGDRVDSDVIATIAQFENLSRALVAERARALAPEHSGTPGIPTDPDACTVTPMSANEVAKRLGTTDRNVRALAGRTSLPGWKVPVLGWQFDPVDVAEFIANRQKAAAL